MAAAFALTLCGLTPLAPALTIVSSYSQNFDAMAGNALPTGWTIDTRNLGNGSTSVDGAAASLASNATGQAYRFNSGSDAAIGLLNSGTFTTGKTIRFAYTNDSAEVVSQIDLAWNYEKYRTGSRAWTWSFASSQGAGAAAGGFAYAADAANTTSIFPPQQTAVAPFAITGLNLAPGESVNFTWTLNGNGGSTNGQGLGIDDFTLSALADVVIIDPPPPPPAPVIIAQQTFDIIGPAYPSSPTATGDAFPDGAVKQQLTNIGSQYNGITPTAAGGMSFKTFYTDTRATEINGPVATNEGGPDFIGVNSFAGANSPDVNPDGVPVAAFSQYNFEFNDGDGRLDLVFDPVDVSAFSDVELSFAYWIANTGFEADDRVTAILTDELGNTVTLLDLGEAALEAGVATNEAAASSWHEVDIAIAGSALTGNLLTLTISVDNNAADENIFVDNIVFRGQPSVGASSVPEPASLLLLGLAGSILASTRRRTT